MNKIKFITNRFWLKKDSKNRPVPASKEIPRWYSVADRFYKSGNKYELDEEGYKYATFKSCHPFMDGMISGYLLKTPCDIEFYINEDGKISSKIKDRKYVNFCTDKYPMGQFHTPIGYHEEHFGWFIDWGIVLPKGYSALYLTPVNRFDLPFLNTVGIIDNDVTHLSGNIPFFIVKGWTGIIPQGTPYVQIFPFKREDWESEYLEESVEKLGIKNHNVSLKYRTPKEQGVYKNIDWHRKIYK
jgi:hypothetical protein